MTAPSLFPPPPRVSQNQCWAGHPTGLVPISIGAQAIDPLTGKPGPVIGAQMDPSAGVVVPIVQVLEALPRGVRDPNVVCMRCLYCSSIHSFSSFTLRAFDAPGKVLGVEIPGELLGVPLSRGLTGSSDQGSDQDDDL